MTIMGVQYLSHQENVRHNVFTEGETHRTNVVNEGIRKGTLDETIRSNQANEGIRLGTLDEAIRHNVQTENLGFASLGETQRHNLATEGIAQGQLGLGFGQLNETRRSNLAREGLIQQQTDETRRYNTNMINQGVHKINIERDKANSLITLQGIQGRAAAVHAGVEAGNMITKVIDAFIPF